jgi:hypothetical protein
VNAERVVCVSAHRVVDQKPSPDTARFHLEICLALSGVSFGDMSCIVRGIVWRYVVHCHGYRLEICRALSGVSFRDMSCIVRGIVLRYVVPCQGYRLEICRALSGVSFGDECGEISENE